MSYCINPKCQNRQNHDSLSICQSCGTDLLINSRYRLVSPLRELNATYPTDIFEVQDWGFGVDNWGTRKVLKVLKYNNNPDLVRLFKQEARTLIFLKDSGIPKVEPDAYFLVTLPEGAKQLHCLVMEFIKGENLAQWLDTNGSISQELALDWLEQLTEILNKIHSQKLLHRDIKTSNLILRPNGELALIDFGTVGVGENGATRVGTIGYAAPEQMIGEAVLQSDFFALGRTFVHLLTGISPMDFPEDSKTGKLFWRKSVKGISKDFADLIDDLMAPSPGKRPNNTRAILNRIMAIRSPLEARHAAIKRELRFLGLVSLGVITSGMLIFQAVFWANIFLNLQLDKRIQNIGTDRYLNKKIEEAELVYNLALIFKGKNLAVQYNLGKICEIRNQLDCAQKKYKMVIHNFKQVKNKEVAAAAISSLTRLQILSEKGEVDVNLIRQGLKLTENQNIQASLYKNLGWVLWQQNRYREAENYLGKAIALSNDYASPYCLLAQVQEAEHANSLDAWENCEKFTDDNNPEERTWRSIARQRRRNAQPPNTS